MLSDAEIQRALHAGRVVPLNVPNPHGPLGLEQLAAAAGLARGESLPERIERPIALSVKTWAKLDDLAKRQTPGRDKSPSASELAAALLEQVVGAEG